MTITAALGKIRSRLLAEAEQSLAAADRYRVSKRQGERNSTPNLCTAGPRLRPGRGAARS